MRRQKQMDDLFQRLLPSASQENVEAARWSILDRVRADIAAGRDVAEIHQLNYGDYHILLVLEGGERHAYAIQTEVEEVTEGATKFGPGTLYTSLDRLLREGLIEETATRRDARLNDETRQYYRLTQMGQKTLAVESERRAARALHVRDRQIVRPI
jgi:DNA-binding PadR family transcriptional regulator